MYPLCVCKAFPEATPAGTVAAVCSRTRSRSRSASGWSVKQLKQKLQELGEKVSGVKADLVKRFKESITEFHNSATPPAVGVLFRSLIESGTTEKDWPDIFKNALVVGHLQIGNKRFGKDILAYARDTIAD